MAIWNLGSINLDMIYSLPHMPAAGETLAAQNFSRFLGGKGANMSVAAQRAGSVVHHIGGVGPDGDWAYDRLTSFGVDTAHVARAETATGHAIISVEPGGENQIILYPGANRALQEADLKQALSMARPGDTFICQNETNLQSEAVRHAREKGMRVCYAAAPFEAEAVAAVLTDLDFLILNEIEAQQLEASTGKAPDALGVDDVIITLGSKGARHIKGASGKVTDVPAYAVMAVDTTGAGDTFTGYVLAGLDQGLSMEEAMAQASVAGALMVMRHGTADVIPTLDEVNKAKL
ncbi:ribokinase [Epibacterium ulvae]|uniref:ribokinase n=1 Tax=Epibacterium ulvae TaxID=1156985 RepID=UPI0024905336|nr:ribokinase [Epibacterium ulvae]